MLMSAIWLVFCYIMVSVGMVHAQGAAYSEAKRLEDVALERARRMKALKEEAAYEPAPRELAVGGPPSSTAVSSRSVAPSAEPFYFQVVTPQGLVPMEEWKAQKSPAGSVATNRSSATPPVPVSPSASSEPNKNRSLRLAFLPVLGDREKNPAVADEGRAVAVGGSKIPEKSKAVPPSVEVTPAVEVARTTPKVAATTTPPPRPGSSGEVVAVFEETPPSGPGDEPKRRILGFLSGRGVEAAAQASTRAGADEPSARLEEAANRPPAKVKPSGVTLDQVASPTPSTSRAEPEPESKEAGEQEVFLKGLGQLVALSRRESFKPARVAPKYTEGGVSKNEEIATADKPENVEYFTIKAARAPFHVIDTGAGQTELVELDAGTVGRKHGEGDEWTWLQLDSGLMGLMKKRYIRPAMNSEVSAFLVAEEKSGASARDGGRDVRYVEVELPHAELSAEEMTSVETPRSSTASASAPAPAGAPTLSTVPSSVSLDGAGGVIAVPSPVPILP